MNSPRRSVLQRFGRRVRRRLLAVFLAFGIGAGLSWSYREEIFNWLLVPGGGMLSPFDGRPIFTSPTDMMSATIHLAIRGGSFVAFPVMVAGVVSLLYPLLLSPQRRFVTIFLPVLAVFFLGGAAFAYYVMLPVGMNFLLHFGDGVAVPVITLPEYIALLTALMFWLGIVFELPLAMFLLAKLKVISYRRMRGFRKYVPVAAFFLGAILTPTVDAVNQAFVAIPIIILYEVGLFLSWLARPAGEDYLLIRRLLRLLRWLAGRPPAAFWASVRLAGRAWRRVRYGRRGIW